MDPGLGRLSRAGARFAAGGMEKDRKRALKGEAFTPCIPDLSHFSPSDSDDRPPRRSGTDPAPQPSPSPSRKQTPAAAPRLPRQQSLSPSQQPRNGPGNGSGYGPGSRTCCAAP